MPPEAPSPARAARPEGHSALLVAIGIFLSRIAGLVRQKAMGHFLGSTAAADAFNAAFRIPNLLQNLFGEGALSASFIPVYAGMLAKGQNRDADRVAGAVGTLLALVCAVIVAVGVYAAPSLVWLLAPGFDGERATLTIHLVQILFPGAGLLVISAWCLGILNSHRKFLLSYTAPVLWNAAMIGALLTYGPSQAPVTLVSTLAVASVVGSLLQFVIQIPSVLRSAPNVRPGFRFRDPDVLAVVRTFGPAFIGRGVMQISSSIDSIIASLLPIGSVAVFGYAQTLYTLPVSLFGMAVSAAELPAMSSATGTDAEIAAWLRARIGGGLQRIAFFVIPSAVAFVVLGDTLAAAFFQSGEFTHDDTVRVWSTLAGSSVGLLAQTWARLYSSTFYALKDTKTPLRFAIIRVVITSALGWFMAVELPGMIGVDPKWGVAGLTASAGMAGWVEYMLLHRALDLRVGTTGVAPRTVMKLWAAGALAGATGIAATLLLPAMHPILTALLVIGPFGVVYLGATWAMGFTEAAPILRRLGLRQRK